MDQFNSDLQARRNQGDSEAIVKYRLNATGNILASTTNNDGIPSEDSRALFEGVSILLSAMTKALHEKNKDLFDYKAWKDLISKSGYFVEVNKFETTLEIKSNELPINAQIIQQLLPVIQNGSSLEVANSVLSAIGGKLKSPDSSDESTFAHLIFFNEEIMGAASVTARLFYASKKSHAAVTSAPCNSRTAQTLYQQQSANTFLLVSPEVIAGYAKKFDRANVPQFYKVLVSELSALITD